ncbi:MAG: hypothetical protein EBU08_06300, partial [Micrococcales bacterium]|nr:hypothetical protein [Micrococcales bacterium]
MTSGKQPEVTPDGSAAPSITKDQLKDYLRQWVRVENEIGTLSAEIKKRKLIHLVADSHTQAFTVKSNSIIGFSTVETMQKTVRKPADVV